MDEFDKTDHERQTYTVREYGCVVTLQEALQQRAGRGFIDVLLARRVSEYAVKHKALVFVPFGPWWHKTTLHERACTILLVRIERQYPVIDDLHDVA